MHAFYSRVMAQAETEERAHASPKTAGVQPLCPFCGEKPVAAHAMVDEAMRRAASAGVDTIEHGYAGSRETFALIAERGIAWLPTLTAPEAIDGLTLSLLAQCEDAPIESATADGAPLPLRRLPIHGAERAFIGLTLAAGESAAVEVTYGA